MKKHELWKHIPIIKETEKAVCIQNTEVSKQMSDIMITERCIFRVPNYNRIKVNGQPFWLPKSQIEIENNQVVRITKWLYNQLILFADNPIVIKEDVENLMKNNYGGKQ